MTDRDVIERLREKVGYGKIYERKPRKEGWKFSWQWSVAVRHEVIQLMTEIRPFMGERRGAKIDELIEYDRQHPAQAWFQHGTLPTYRRGCRCDACVEHEEWYDNSRRVTVRKVPPARCGTPSKYVKGCRCTECRAAWAKEMRDYRRRKREEAMAAKEAA